MNTEKLDKLLDNMVQSTDKMVKYFNFKASHRGIYFKALINENFTREEAMQILLNEEK